MAQKERAIGIYGPANLEIFHRPVNGVLKYCQQQTGFRIVDFRLAQLLNLASGRPPPWRGKVDGVILGMGGTAGLTSRQTADWMLGGGAPVVSVAADWFDPRVPTVFVNRPSLAELAAKHLRECECRTFLFFGYAPSTGSQARGTAFRQALQRRGHEPVVYETSELFLGAYEDEAALDRDARLTRHLKTLPKPLGVWALNDNYARAVCRACERLELRVPEQVKVLGVDDLAIARLSPAISSIRTPGEEIGFQAMRELHKLLDGRRGVRETIEVKATELQVRDSTMHVRAIPGDLENVLEHVRRHACDGVTVDHLVSLVGGSRRSLTERFRAHVGHSIGEEIQRVRVDRAKALLSETQLSITRIASMVGYAETAAFSKFFRKATGMSPRDHRDRGPKRGA